MSEVSVQRDGALALVTIDPASGFMTEATVAALNAATEALDADAECRGIVLTGGRDGVFVRHYDVRELAGMSDAMRAKEMRFSDAQLLRRDRDIDVLLRRLSTTPKITIAAINGFAMGGGFELCLACDLRIAAPGDYEVGLPEIKIGLLPGAGGTQRMLRLIGRGRAAELLLRGGTVPPTQALAYGLVNEISDDLPVVDRAMALARDYADMPPVAFAHIKRLLHEGADLPLEEALTLERTLFLDTLVSEDANRLMHTMNDEARDIRHMKR